MDQINGYSSEPALAQDEHKLSDKGKASAIRSRVIGRSVQKKVDGEDETCKGAVEDEHTRVFSPWDDHDIGGNDRGSGQQTDN